MENKDIKLWIAAGLIVNALCMVFIRLLFYEARDGGEIFDLTPRIKNLHDLDQ